MEKTSIRAGVPRKAKQGDANTWTCTGKYMTYSNNSNSTNCSLNFPSILGFYEPSH